MNDALRHRGPDEEGSYLKGPVGLAMRRLSIIDPEGGSQPMTNEDGTVQVVFNGEIYNHAALRSQLECQGHVFRSRADTEVLAHLYEERGEDLVHSLRGMYAFAVWDERARKLLVARDPVGIKPLYYRCDGDGMAFASEIKALARDPHWSRRIDYTALADYLSFLAIPAPKSIFRDVAKLSPGHMLTMQQGVMRVRKYWEMPMARDGGQDEKSSAHALRGLLEEAVRSHLMSDVPLGVFLSGGVDSGIVATLAAKHTDKTLETFSVGFDSPAYDERPYAQEVADSLGVEHHALCLKEDCLEDLPRIVGQFDEPFADSSAIPTYHLSRWARQRVKVALAGDGGDELFAGYGWLRRERFVEMARSMPRALRAGLAGLGRDTDPFAIGANPWDGARRFLGDSLGSPLQGVYRRSTCCTPAMLRELLRPEIVSQMGSYQPAGLFEQVTQQAGEDAYARSLSWDTRVYLPDDDLCKVDRMSMAHSLEVRVPMLDLDLVEFSARLPLQQKLRGGTTKYLLKKAFADMLPPRTLRQRKQGFAIPVHDWMRARLPQMEPILTNPEGFCQQVFRPETTRHVLDLHRTGRYRLGGVVYSMLVLELWAQRVLRGHEDAASLKLEEMVV